ncbi:hypothetical protein PRUPE_1G474800 [Prunus persica]|uniref:Uncharacterized protein n=1 Tax=Prunus persica TaxID=3760 RepID=A0A251RE95_PRUPE|nr:hypothetical protein PRUPE_1G474800 [Prunus persica]
MQELDSFSLCPLRCIYRVPKRLRQGNDDEAYTPQVVSIGPLHHGKEHLNGMEYHKKRYLRSFLRRTTITLEFLKKKLRDQEARLRSCYAEPIEYSSEDFLKIILVDAVFVIEFLLKCSEEKIGDEDDYIFYRPWMCIKFGQQIYKFPLRPFSNSTAIKSAICSTSAGVKLKVGLTKNLFDIQFDDRTLEIPRLEISDSTEVLIRNLIAFEQCHYKEKHISDYISLMDSFVNTPKDVELLVKYDIVETFLGDNREVSTLINKLGKGVQINVNNFHFASVCEDLNKYYRTSWNEWKATLRQNYFNTPWAIISFLAAVSFLILTFIQAVCSILYIA